MASTTTAARENVSGIPDIKVSARQLFGIDTDMEVPAFSTATEHVPEVDDAYLFDSDTTMAILAGFAHNRRVMVHGLNPWGFAHRSRTTENNVNLNRNFVDHGGAAPENPVYAELHPALCPKEWTDATVAASKRAVEEFVARNGRAMLSDYLRRGQYTHTTGLNYGGRAREWSNRILEIIVATELAGAEKVAIIDWHTGLGQRGEDFFICFDDKGTAEFDQAVRWWGAAKVDREKAFEGEDRPRYTGLVFHGVRDFLDGRALAGAVIEFGTRPGIEMREALRADRWLKFACPDRSAPLANTLQADIFEAFCPHDDTWRRTVAAAARRIQAEALAGVGSW